MLPVAIPAEPPVPPCGTVTRDLLAVGPMDWIALFQFIYEGEMYEYAFPCGPATQTARQAAATAEREGLRHGARLKFLTDVNLETTH